MYRIILNDKTILQSDAPNFAKLKEMYTTIDGKIVLLGKCWIQCDYQSAECLVINGVRYSIEGRPKVDDAPQVVTVKEIDSAENMLATEKDVGLIFFALNNIIDDLNKRLGD